MSIKPSVGRVVWFHPSATDPININGSGPLAALIAYVHSDSMVNLAVFDGNGDAQSRTSVTLIQEGEDRPVGLFCEWMPFQKGQAAKTEAVETKLAQVTDAGVEQEIQSKGLAAPRVTPDGIEAAIVSEHYGTANRLNDMHVVHPTGKSYPKSLGLLTFCVLVLKNGFTVTGESACASPENFDAELGRKIARENAKQKIWALEGYLLKQRLSEE